MKGAINKAEQLNEEIPDSWIPQQFNNPANRRFTAKLFEASKGKTGPAPTAAH